MSPAPAPQRRRAVIIGALLTLALLLGVSACSRVTLAYRQADLLAMWWLDREFDLHGAQRQRVQADVDALAAWHRSQMLPALISQLTRWRAQVPAEVDAAQVCAEWTQLRTHLDALGVQAAPAGVRLLQGLSAEQLRHLGERQTESNTEFTERFLAGAERALESRLERARERVEMFYGSLDKPQLQALARDLQAEPFDAAWALALREKRQAQLVALVARLQSTALPAERAQEEALAWWRTALDPQDPGDRARWQARLQGACRTVAAIHARATPAQRQHAVRTLGEWIQSLQALTVR